MNEKVRNSNLELLRIISIIMIISLHMFRHSANEEIYMSSLTLNKLFFMMIGSWGLVGVDIFVLISSWFLLESNRIKIDKVLQIVLTAAIYNSFTYIIYLVISGNPLTPTLLVRCLLSAFIGQYWFVIAYLLLYILHPVLNIVISSLDNRKLKIVSGSLLVLSFLYKFIIGSAPINTLSIFISIYFVSAMLKRKDLPKNFNRIAFITSIFSVIFVIGVQVIASLVGYNDGIISHITSRIAVSSISKYSPFMLVIAVWLFITFENKTPFYNRAINKLATTTLAVYIIHESDYLISILWDDMFKIGSVYNEVYMPLYLIVVLLIVFISCSIIDLIVQPIYVFISRKIGGFVDIY